MSKVVATSTSKRNLLAKTVALVKQPLFANAGYLMGVNLVSSVAGFVFWGVTARLYHAENVGTATAVLSAVVVVAGIARLGVDTGLVRFLPQARSPHRLLNTVLTFSAVMAFLIGGIFLAGLSLWSPSLLGLQRNGLYMIGFLTYAVAETLGTVVRMAFVARRQALYTLIHTGIVNGGRLLMVVALAGLGVIGLVGSVALAVILAVAISLARFLPRVETGYRPRPDLCWLDLATIVPYSVGNYVANLLTQTSQAVLPLLILETLGPASSGHAYVAWMLGSLLTGPGMALAVSAFAEGSHSPHRLTAILTRSAVSSLLLTILAAVIVGLAAPWFLLLFGSSYAQEASGLLRWMAAAAPLAVLTGLYFTYLRVQKRVGHLILLSGLVAAATLGAAVALMPRFGIAANGMGWLTGNALVAAIAIGSVWKDAAKNRKEI